MNFNCGGELRGVKPHYFAGFQQLHESLEKSGIILVP